MLQEKLKRVSIFGAGLLVGTALTVIIPEGIRALYSSCHAGHDHHAHAHAPNQSHPPEEESHGGGNEETMIGLTLILGFIFMMIIDQLTHALQHSGSSPGGASAASHGSSSGHGSAKFFFLKDFSRSSVS